MSSTEKRPDGVIVIRDDLGKPIRKMITKGLGPKQTVRQLISRLTNGGEELVITLYDIAQGKAHVCTLPDGRVSEPMIPTFEVRRAAAKDLLELFGGKAVPQTEIMKAEEQSEKQAQLDAMTPEELWAIIEADRERKQLSDESDRPAEADPV